MVFKVEGTRTEQMVPHEVRAFISFVSEVTECPVSVALWMPVEAAALATRVSVGSGHPRFTVRHTANGAIVQPPPPSGGVRMCGLLIVSLIELRSVQAPGGGGARL